jgi:hypothetical protein
MKTEKVNFHVDNPQPDFDATLIHTRHTHHCMLLAFLYRNMLSGVFGHPCITCCGDPAEVHIQTENGEK